MTINEARILIEQTLIQEWGDKTKICYANFLEFPINEPYIMPQFFTNLMWDEEMGIHGVSIMEATLMITVAVVKNTGTGDAYDWASDLSDLFSKQVLGDITFEEAIIEDNGINKDTGFYEVFVIIPCFIFVSH
jgi:hypothetical protein